MKKILLYNSGGGLGDSIQLFTLIISLQKHFKNSDFFYLGAHENHFVGGLKDFNINIQTLNLKLRYFGFRWWHFFFVKKNFENLGLDKFDLIIDLQSKVRNTVILKRIPHDSFYSTTMNYRFCTKKIDFFSDDHLENLKNFLEVEIKTYKFNMKNLPEKFMMEAIRLLPDKNYIGFSVTQGNVYREKSWSISNFIDLANKIANENKIPVFFIKKDETEIIDEIKSRVPSALFPEMHSNLSCPALVTALASRLSLAISIDNGIMHMIGLANIPMIVLFGPTNSEKFAPKIDEIKILDSKNIYKTSDINSISVYDVFKLI